MKLVFFDDFKLGVVKGDTVVDMSNAVSGIEHTSPQDLIGKLIENFSQYRASFAQTTEHHLYGCELHGRRNPGRTSPDQRLPKIA